MTAIRVLVLRAPGINCDEETAFAWEMAGADVDRVHVHRLIESPRLLDGYRILTVPGGFSYGDDIAGGRILGNIMVHHLGEALRRFVDRGGLILGICNGFQVLVRAGLLPGAGCDVPVTLTLNDTARYEDRWVRVRGDVGHSPFIERGDVFWFPVAHGEGKVAIPDDAGVRERIAASGRVAMRYVDGEGDLAGFPHNPNGSIENAAALTDSTGRVFGLMPHPERNLFPTNAPDAVADASAASDGARFFSRIVERISSLTH